LSSSFVATSYIIEIHVKDQKRPSYTLSLFTDKLQV